MRRLVLGESEADEARFAAWLDMAQTLRYRYPHRARRGARCTHAGSEPHLHLRIVRAHRRVCGTAAGGARDCPCRAAQGAIVLAHCAVRGIERTGGRIAAVITERGRIGCDAVILAGGAWSSLFCASLGIRLPQLKVLSSVMRTAPVADGPDSCTYMDEVGYRSAP